MDPNLHPQQQQQQQHHQQQQQQQQQQQLQSSVDNLDNGGQSAGYCSRLRTSIGQPERLQPTIFAISLTYIVYTLSVTAGLLPAQPASSQFTYYCCILGLCSSILFYLKYCCKREHQRSWMLIYNLLLVLLILLYIGHWFVKPNSTPPSSLAPLGTPKNSTPRYYPNSGPAHTRTTKAVQIIKQQEIHPKTNNNSNINSQTSQPDQCNSNDKSKCDQPLHRVLQVAFIATVLASLIVSSDISQ